MRGPGLDFSYAAQGHVARCYGNDNKLSDSIECVNNFTSRKTISFSKRTLLHGVS
jgi:hypothetical protein